MMIDARAARLSYLARNHAWRRQATALLRHVDLIHLPDHARATLRREAEAADRQADMWLEGAIEAG
jgi:hypothetical protein